jgi:hypothetical protein
MPIETPRMPACNDPVGPAGVAASIYDPQTDSLLQSMGSLAVKT